MFQKCDAMADLSVWFNLRFLKCSFVQNAFLVKHNCGIQRDAKPFPIALSLLLKHHEWDGFAFNISSHLDFNTTDQPCWCCFDRNERAKGNDFTTLWMDNDE